MRLNELPKKITELGNIGELFVWRVLSFVVIVGTPESACKETIVKIINDRIDFLLCSEISPTEATE